MCGEECSASAKIFLASGLPPRVWRRVCCAIASYSNIRVTSTCVEKRLGQVYYNKYVRGYLHMCGEESILHSHIMSTLGLPPHVWRRD